MQQKGAGRVDSLMKCTNIIARCATRRRNKELESIGLTGNQYAFILNICRNPGLTQEELSSLIYIHKSNVDRQVAALCEAGFVYREISAKDKRQMCLYPTEKAKEALPQIRQTLTDWNGYLLEEFSQEEQETLLSMINRLSLRARAWVDQEDAKR